MEIDRVDIVQPLRDQPPLALTRFGSNVRVARVRYLRGWWAQGVGVIGISSLPPGVGFVFPGVSAIHTFFVRFPLDILFFDDTLTLLKVVRSVRPWRPLVHCPGAYYTVELGAGTIDGAELFEIGKQWRIDTDIHEYEDLHKA